jgi:hypothetical protein
MKLEVTYGKDRQGEQIHKARGLLCSEAAEQQEQATAEQPRAEMRKASCRKVSFDL